MKDFLLKTDTAKHLYHDIASKLPIIDYHCHLSPREIAEDKQFRSITELWLGGDHYKWRAMRANGISEKYITGDATDWEKFQAWAATVPYTLRNPLYHWTHLELRTAFGIDEKLCPESAKRIYDRCNELLKTPGFSARGMMRRYNVEAVCTTDDPIDSLEWHDKIRQSGFEIKVLPAWRPDKAFSGDDAYLKKLLEVSGQADVLDALKARHDYFASKGCTVADHGFGQVKSSPLLIEALKLNARKGWVQQFHFGPMRNVNSRMYAKLGPDAGFDTIGDYRDAAEIAKIMDALDREELLAKTILYNINPADNTWVAAMIGNFQDGSVPGKIQMGSAWWFNDQLYGMRAQIDALSAQGLLSRFVGMLTDSRSFLSYPRHEYFRRLLCDMLGDDVERGLIPLSEMPMVEKMVADISYHNVKNYFDL